MIVLPTFVFSTTQHNQIEIDKPALSLHEIKTDNPIHHEGDNDKNQNLIVYISDESILIRTKYNDKQDLIYKFLYKGTKQRNGNFTGHSVYLVPTKFTNTENLINFLVHKIDDSISALGTPAYWFILGQHGYYIPRVTIELNSFKVGELLKDEFNRTYEVIYKAQDDLYLAPTLSEKSHDNSWTHGSKNFSTLSSMNEKSISKVKKVSGFQIKPMMKKKQQKIIIDGQEVNKKGEYHAKTVKLNDIFVCVDPMGAKFEGIDRMSGEELIQVEQTYTFKGKSIFSKTILDVKKDLPFTKYHGIQPVGLKTSKGYKIYAIYPKVATKPKNGKRLAVDWNSPTDITEESNSKYSQYLFKVNSQDLKDIRDIPDRVIHFQKKSNSEEFGIGFAAGLDLAEGLTSKKNRPKYTDEAFALSGNLSNKTYFRVLTASKFKNGVLPAGFIGQFNSYFTYFEPKENQQIYIVHAENATYKYIHLQKKVASRSLDIEDYLQGKRYSIIESNGVDILEDKSNNKLKKKMKIRNKNEKGDYLVIKVQN